MIDEWEQQFQDLAAQPRASIAEAEECKAGWFEVAGPGAHPTQLTVARADPAILVDTQTLQWFMLGLNPHITYDHANRLLKVEATNGRWVYRVGRPVRADDGRVTALCLRWPD